MKGIVSLALLALLLIAVVGNEVGGENKHKLKHARPQAQNKHRLKHAHTVRKRSSEYEPDFDEDDQQQQVIGVVAPFDQIGKEHCFTYNGQIASGYAPWVSTQQATTRIEAKACITLAERQKAVLRLQQPRIGQRNEDSQMDDEEPFNSAKIMPMAAFQQQRMDRSTAERMKQKLELPVEFNYADGSVERLLFHKEDEPWSKNVKKAVLNMIQLHQKMADNQQGEQPIEQVDRSNRRPDRLADAYQIMETTIEGTCETTYTVLSAPSPAFGDEQAAEVNVTKTIDFNRCTDLADVAYGFQAEPAVEGSKEQQQKEQVPIADPSSASPSGRVIPREKLDRSTTIRYVLGKKSAGGYKLQRVELLSEYVLKSSQAETSPAMQTTVAAELIYTGSQSANDGEQQPQLTSSERNEKEETLLYNVDIESLEKLYYMYGDEKYTGEQAIIPFRLQRNNSQGVVAQAANHLRTMAKQFDDSERSTGIEAMYALEHFEKLVRLLRMCSVDELKQVERDSTKIQDNNPDASIDQTSAAADLFADALAVAATRNTIYLLAKKIEEKAGGNNNNGMSEAKAVQVLKVLGRGAGLPSISVAQADVILTLCKSDAVRESKKLLKQSCWLTFGTMVGELAQQTHKTKQMGETRSPLKPSEKAESAKMTLYKEVFEQNLVEAGSNLYEKILALKSIGNAGLPSTLPLLAAIAEDRREPHLIRITAMDATRRMRHHLPGQVLQFIALPIYVNINEEPEVRMAAFSTIMQTRPQAAVIDQIVFVMGKEKCSNVQAFVRSVIQAAAKSPIEEERKSADHLKHAMKLARIEEKQFETKEKQKSSRSTTQFYSYEQQEGAFLSIVQTFSPEDMHARIPSHFSIGLDTYFNGQFNRNAIKLSMCQKDWEKLARQAFDSNNKQQDDEQESSGIMANAARKLRSIAEKLRIKRRGAQQPANKRSEQPPYLVLSVRLNDVDVGIVPIVGMDQTQGASFGRALGDAFRHFFGASSSQHRAQINAAMVINSRQTAVPTSLGMGLRTVQSMYLVGQLKGQWQAQANGQYKLKIHPNGNWIQTQKMEVCAMTACSGVQSTRTVAVNWPLEVEAGKSDKDYRLRVKVPQEKTRLLTAQSLPATYLRRIVAPSSQKQEGGQPRDYRLKTIYSEQLQAQSRQAEKSFGKRGDSSFFRIPLTIHGHYTAPRNWFDLKEALRVIMSTQNDVVVDMDANENTPKAIDFAIQMDTFRPSTTSPSTSLRARLQDFFGRRTQTSDQQGSGEGMALDESSSSEEEQEQQRGRGQSTNDKRRQEKKREYSDHLDRFERTQPRNYKHIAKLSVQTIGSGENSHAELILEGTCDARHRVCQAIAKAECSPMAGDQDKWKMKAEVQTLYPEHVNDIQELLQDSDSDQVDKQQKFFCHTSVQWGREGQKQETMTVNVQGEPSARMVREIREQVQQQQRSRSTGQRRQQRKQKIMPFIDQYQAVADYSIHPDTDYFFQCRVEEMKTYFFWNTYSKLNSPEAQRRGNNAMAKRDGKDMEGTAECTMRIEPEAGAHANVSIHLPTHRIWIREVRLPMKVRPMLLVRAPQRQSIAHESAGHAFQHMLDEEMSGEKGGRQARAQCKVGAKTVDTFDGVAYRAPISKCYTVLAKDCANREQPKFAVLMKSVAGGEEKRIKIITPSKEMTVEPRGNNQLRLQLNGQTYSIDSTQFQEQSVEEKRLHQQGIDFETDYQGQQVVTIDLGPLAVKFDGKTTKIQLTEDYKSLQCGLCGNFNDDQEDELRHADGQLSGDLRAFHRSYTMQEDEECEEQEHRQFYTDDKKDGFQYNQPEKVIPQPRTLTIEYNHKVCFSLRTVKQCPEGWYAGEQDNEQAMELMKRIRVQFTCLDRHSVEAKRLRAEVRRTGVANIGEYPASFVEQVAVPETCVKV